MEGDLTVDSNLTVQGGATMSSGLSVGGQISQGGVSLDSTYLNVGGDTMSGDLNMGDHNISGVQAIAADSLVLADGAKSMWYDKLGTIYETNFATDPFYAGSLWTNVNNTSWDSASGGSIQGSHGIPTPDCRARVALGPQPYGLYEATFSVSNVYGWANFIVRKAGVEKQSFTYGPGTHTMMWTAEWDAIDFYHLALICPHV